MLSSASDSETPPGRIAAQSENSQLLAWSFDAKSWSYRKMPAILVLALKTPISLHTWFSRDSIHGLLTPLALSASCWCLLSLSPKSVNCRRTSFRASENQQVHVCRVEVADSCSHFLFHYPDTTPISTRI